MSPAILILCVISAILALVMLFSRSPITAALSLLGILIMTAGIYGLIGEHMVATIQLVVYAGAIMVLFIFSIMLLNLTESETEHKAKPVLFYGSFLLGMGILGLLMVGLRDHYSMPLSRVTGEFSPQAIAELGGNSKVLAHALFSKFYVTFEVISLALLVAVVGAVVLAKRKVD